MTTLPTNIESAYPDRGPGDQVHQQHHDIVHDVVNKLTAGPLPADTVVLLRALAATDALRGLVELATTTETIAGTDAARTVTPLGLAASSQSRQAVQFTAGTDGIVASAASPITGDLEVIIEQTPGGSAWASHNPAILNFIIGDRSGTTGWSILVFGSLTYISRYRGGVLQQVGIGGLLMSAMDAARFLRFRLDVDNGAGVMAGSAAWSHDGITWTEATAVGGAGTAGVSDASAAPIRVGSAHAGPSNGLPNANYRRVEVRNGFGGPVVTEWKADHVGDSGTYVDTTGKTWQFIGTGWRWIDAQRKVIGAPFPTTGLVQVGPRSLEGTGNPEGVVSAPVGWRYTDRAATNGAIEWIKASGTGNTGWQVVFGDTGWRNVAAELMNGFTSPASYELRVRRQNNLVSMVGRLTAPGGQTNYWTAPFGIRGRSSPAPLVITVAPIAGTPLRGAFGATYIVGVFPAPAAATLIDVTGTWPVTESWPTVLPGVAG